MNFFSLFANLPFLSSFFAPSGFLGIDIGTSSIKIVEISPSTDKPQLKNYGILDTYGHLERLNNAIQTSSLKILENETVGLLKTLLKELKVKNRKAIASLPSFLAFSTLLELPEMSSEDVRKTVGFQARQYIPLPISEVTLDWVNVGVREDIDGVKKQQIFLTSVPNEHIRKYRAIFKAAGLNLIALEMESFSLARALVNKDNTSTLIVDVGARSTNILVVDQGFLKHSSQTDFAGGSLTQSIATGLNINIKRAETLKKQFGLLGSRGEYELSTLILPFLDAIIEEVKRVKRIYEDDYQGKIEKIILTGGGANLLGIEKYFFEQFGLTTIKGEPFNNLSYPEEIKLVVNELNTLFAAPIGLGIRELTK